MNARSTLFPRRRPAVAATPKQLLVRTGRVALWAAVAVVLARGLADVLSAPPSPAPSAVGSAGVVWPDDPARAFASEFTAAYLDGADGHDPAAAAQAMGRFASGELVDALTPRLDGHGPRRPVGSVTIASAERLDRTHALITTVAALAGDAARTVRLTVPVARDASGGLAVYDLPSLAPAPSRAVVAASEDEPLTGAERDAIFDVLARYFRGYLAGDVGGLAYLVPAGTRPAAALPGFELVELDSIAAAGPATPSGRRVLATVEARDRASGAVLALRYRIAMVHRDRWYVAQLNRAGGPR